MKDKFDFDKHLDELKRKVEAGELSGEYVDPELLQGAVSDDEAGEPPTQDELKYEAEVDAMLAGLKRSYEEGTLDPRHPLYKVLKDGKFDNYPYKPGC